MGSNHFQSKFLDMKNVKISPQILELIISQISELFIENSKVTPEFISSDGDSGYNTLYSNEFYLLYNHFKKIWIEWFN